MHASAHCCLSLHCFSLYRTTIFWAVSSERGSCARTVPPCPWEVNAVGEQADVGAQAWTTVGPIRACGTRHPGRESSPCSTVGKPAGVAMGNGSKGIVFSCFGMVRHVRGTPQVVCRRCSRHWCSLIDCNFWDCFLVRMCCVVGVCIASVGGHWMFGQSERIDSCAWHIRRSVRK